MGLEYLEATIGWGERRPIEGGHGAPVAPEDAVLEVVEREEVAAEVIAGAGEELVALVGVGGDTWELAGGRRQEAGGRRQEAGRKSQEA